MSHLSREMLLDPGARVRCKLTGCLGVVMPYDRQYSFSSFPVNFNGRWRIKSIDDVEVVPAVVRPPVASDGAA